MRWRAAACALALASVCAGSASAAVVPAPTLGMSPRAGPVGTMVRVTGAAPRAGPCPFVRVTVTRRAGGAADVLRVYRVVRGRYAGAFRAPAVQQPTTPPSIVRILVVRAACAPSRRGSYARARSASVAFRVLGALSP
jgi:hypothetical protein